MIFGSFEGAAGEVEEPTPLFNAAMSSLRLVTTYTCSGTAAAPPVTPVPLAAQPFCSCKVSRPRSLWSRATAVVQLNAASKQAARRLAPQRFGFDMIVTPHP